MKKLTAFYTAARAGGVALALAACSSGLQGTGPIPNGSAAFSGQNAALTGASHPGVRRAGTNAYLYVSDGADNVVKVLSNAGYRDAGAITTGISRPSGVTLDKSNNLYVANLQGANVTEYAPGSTTPAFTYSEGMTQPYAVTTDNHGNLFEADYGGVVNEYFQGVNTTVTSCQPGIGLGGNGAVTGVAIDKNGDVFVSYIQPVGTSGGIVEYFNGLFNCNAQPIPLTFGYPEGIALDSAGNLIVCETTANVIDVIAPPYSSITRTIATGFGGPISVSLGAGNKRAYIAYNHDIVIVDYQTGATLKVLDNGFDNVGGAVDGPNAVY